MLSRRTAIGFISFALIPTVARADDLYDEYINSVSKVPFIAFMGRNSDHLGGKPGHSFISVATEIDNGEIFYWSFYGFYPKDENALQEIKSVFAPVAGSLKFKWQDLGWSVYYRKNVDDAQKNAAMAVVKKWGAADAQYRLLGNDSKNCSNFAAEVAKAIGLKVPSGAGDKWPTDFMTELKSLNQ